MADTLKMTTSEKPVFDVQLVTRAWKAEPTAFGDQRVVGPIWVRLGDLDFPGAGWLDDPMAILAGWCAAVFDSAEGRGNGELLLFFLDGPYRISLGPRSDGYVVSALTATAGGETSVDFHGFSREIVAESLGIAARAALEWARTNRFRNRDVDVLTSSLRRLV